MNLSLDQLPFNVFDLVLVAVLGAGIVRGRKHGMSEELLYLLMWLATAAGCTLLYQPLGQFLAQSSPFSLLASYLIAYIGVGLAIVGLFGLIRHHLGGKLLGSDVFGRSEFYLGMGSGLVRFGCMLAMGLALLNAPYYTPAEVRAREKFQNDVYGSDFFPGLHDMQEAVFHKSLCGPWIRGNLGFLLIKPTHGGTKEFHMKESDLPY